MHPRTLELTDAQKTDLVQAAGRWVRETVLGEPLTPLPEEMVRIPVSGTFVSLKRGGHLRSCCGGLQDRGVHLGAVLANSVSATVFEDTRFPPISPTELPFLELELWLLFNPQVIEEQGEARDQAVKTGGKHGLIVHAPQGRGLLLPGVAAEYGWDARTFLEQVCVKAGMHPSRWKEPTTTVVTFEGVSLRGRLPAEARLAEGIPFLSPEQVEGYNELCRYNLQALVEGRTPVYSVPGLPDGNISGLILSLDPGDGGEPLQWSRLDLQRGMALQATLFQLTQAAAQALGSRMLPLEKLAGVSLAVLYDPALHGTVGDPQLEGFAPQRRALLVLEQARSALLFDRQKESLELVEECAARARVKRREGSPLFSLEVNTRGARFLFSSVPRPETGPSVRPPAAAGTFYPAQPAALKELVDQFLEFDQEKEPWAAAMVPHAGLKYSGKLAGKVLSRLRMPSTVIILGPKHTPRGVDWAIAPHTHWTLPGSQLRGDEEWIRALAEAIPDWQVDAGAHAQEHGIEVELPFLAQLAPQTRIVGVALGPASWEECRQFAGGLAQVLKARPEPPLLLISSDMNHFASDSETRVLDELALQAMESLDPRRLFDVVHEHHISMCGLVPAVIVMETLRQLENLHRCERVGYCTSADATGDASRVVGYAGMFLG